MDSDREEQNYSLDFSSSEESESSKEESNSYLETQELEYSTDLSSTSSGETSSDESLPDVLKPFDFEPVCSPRKDLISESPQSSEDGEQVKRKEKKISVCALLHSLNVLYRIYLSMKRFSLSPKTVSPLKTAV